MLGRNDYTRAILALKVQNRAYELSYFQQDACKQEIALNLKLIRKLEKERDRPRRLI